MSKERQQLTADARERFIYLVAAWVKHNSTRVDDEGAERAVFFWRRNEGAHLNPFTTGNPSWGHFFHGFSIGRGSGALNGLI